MICLNCGRKLKSVVSREAGYGPVCDRRLFGTTLLMKWREATRLECAGI